MKTHGKLSKPIELGKVVACSINEDGQVNLIFGINFQSKAGVSFDETESAIIVRAVGDYIGKQVFTDYPEGE